MRGVWSDPQRRAQCADIVKACRKMSCEAIAVDVDSEANAELLSTLGCQLGTGTFLSQRYEAAESVDGGQDIGPRLIREPVLV